MVFDYTKTAINIIIKDIKKYYNIFKYSSMIFTMLYFVYVLSNDYGYFGVNLTLLVLFVVYMILDFFTNRKHFKLLKKFVRRSYKGIKFINKTFSLGVMIYGVYVASSNVSGFSIILATLMIITWVLEVILELIVVIFEDKKDLLIEGWNKDIENLKRPITTVNNFIKKVKGEEVEEVSSSSRKIKILEKRMNRKNHD